MSYQKLATKSALCCQRASSYSHYGMEPGNPDCLGSLWVRRAGGRPCQSRWESRVLVNASRINLVLSEIFCPVKIRSLELRPIKHGSLKLRIGAPNALHPSPRELGSLELTMGKRGSLQPGSLEFGVYKLSVLEIGPFQVGVLELDLYHIGALEVRPRQASMLELGSSQVGALELRPIKRGSLQLGSLQV